MNNFFLNDPDSVSNALDVIPINFYLFNSKNEVVWCNKNQLAFLGMTSISEIRRY